MIENFRSCIKFLGLKKLVIFSVQNLALIKNIWVIKRDGIRYQVDLNKVIDFGIFLGGWERTTINVIKKTLKKDDVVIEVGANIGAHTLLIAKLIGPNGFVYAFEPTEFALRKLRKNLSLNEGFKNIWVIDSLVSDNSNKLSEVRVNSDWALDGVQAPESLVNKKITTIDEFVFQNNISRLDFLKVDVDGFDYKVLHGAKKSIDKFKPVIFCELCEYTLKENGDSIDKIFSYLLGMGYECFDEAYGAPLNLITAKKTVGFNSSINGIFRFINP